VQTSVVGQVLLHENQRNLHSRVSDFTAYWLRQFC
jgi:hypothetical protein